jgi:hypothetical protein
LIGCRFRTTPAERSRRLPRSWLGRKVRDLVLPVFLRKAAAAAARLYEGEAEVA